MAKAITGMVLAMALMGSMTADEQTANGKARVGFFASTGSEGASRALKDDPRFVAETLKSLDADRLFQYDAIVLGSVKGGVGNSDWQDALEVYLKSGGGVLLHHDATGFRGWKKPLFPEVFRGVAKSREINVKVIAPNHPIAKGLPATFAHAYPDHIVLAKGPVGEILVTDAVDSPVVVVGTLGSGRVVGNGMITGYALQSPEGNQEKAPEGGEKQLLLNALTWLTEKPLTKQPAAEVAKRRQQYENEALIRKSADVAGGVARQNAATANGEWTHPTRFNEHGFARPPMELLPGRFFLFDGMSVSVGSRQNQPRSYEETVAVLWQLKWAGVTDLIAYFGGYGRFDYPTDVPGAATTGRGQKFARLNFNLLSHMEKACAETGIGLWCFWHSTVRDVGKKDMESLHNLMIKDAKGNLYGHYMDVTNPATLAQAEASVRELADRYNKNGAIQGIFLDEFWHSFNIDRLEDNIPDFIAHCEKTYGEKPPADIAEKFGKGNKWHDPKDVWWRRFMLWRNAFIADFTERLTKTANAKGLRIMTQPAFPLTWEMGWSGGTGKTSRLAAVGDLLWSNEGRFNYLYEDYPEDRTIFGTHTNAHSGFSMVSLVRGNYGSLFTFNSSWAPLLFGESPRTVEIMERIIRGNREWFGATKLDQTAVLVNEMGLTLAHKDPSDVFKRNDALVRDRVSYKVRTSMVLVENTAFFKRYKTLIAPRYALEYLSAESYAGLVDFVKAGGALIVLDGKVSISAPDLTDVIDKTEELTGTEKTGETYKISDALRLADAGHKFAFPAIEGDKMAVKNPAAKVLSAAGDKPLIVASPLGAGKVITLSFDLPALLADDATVDTAADLMVALQSFREKPPVQAEGKIKIVSNLKKGNWVVVTFLRRDVDFYESDDIGKYPSAGKLRIDMKALGLDFAQYRVYSLARDREMFPQGPYFNAFGNVWWNADILKTQGIDVVLTPDNQADLKLNYKTDDAYLNRFVLPKWDERYKTRCYEHEIIAIAPVGEPGPIGRPKPMKTLR